MEHQCNPRDQRPKGRVLKELMAGSGPPTLVLLEWCSPRSWGGGDSSMDGMGQSQVSN